jgi:hypothetical protein
MKKYIFYLCAMVIGTAACSGSDSPKGVVENYYSALKSGNYKKAVGFSCDKLKDEEKFEKERDKYATEYEELVKGLVGTITSYNFIEEKIAKDGMSAEVKGEYEIKEEEGKKEETEKLEKINGQWCINLW